MDPRIENLKSTTFFGKRLTRRQIADIQEDGGVVSRAEPSRTEQHDLRAPRLVHAERRVPGSSPALACLSSWRRLASCLCRRRGCRCREALARSRCGRTGRTPVPTIGDDLKRLTPLVLQVVTEKDAVEEWNELVDRHHYLGSRRPFGPHLRYVILDNRRRKLGCLMFEAATTALPCRDQWIGWREQDRAKRLNLVVNNSRFMIFPWVKVKFLASKALSVALRQLAGDWEAQHGFRPVLAETFVDLAKFEATCYRAANWQKIGMDEGTQGECGGGRQDTEGRLRLPPGAELQIDIAERAAAGQAPVQAAVAEPHPGRPVRATLERHHRNSSSLSPTTTTGSGSSAGGC